MSFRGSGGLSSFSLSSFKKIKCETDQQLCSTHARTQSNMHEVPILRVLDTVPCTTCSACIIHEKWEMHAPHQAQQPPAWHYNIFYRSMDSYWMPMGHQSAITCPGCRPLCHPLAQQGEAHLTLARDWGGSQQVEGRRPCRL